MEKVEARMILEVMGRPPEHIISTINGVIDKLATEKGVSIKERKVHDVKKVDESKDLYSTYAEIYVVFDSLQHYLGILFAYMPSNTDIISPQNIKMTNDDINSIGNMILNRLHGYDSVTKRLLVERDILINRMTKEGIKLDVDSFMTEEEKPKKKSQKK